MQLDLARLARRTGKRAAITVRPILPTVAHAQDLALIYLDVARIWTDATPMIMAGYSGMTTDSAAENQAAIDAAQDQVARLVLAFGARVREWAVRVEKWHRQKWADAVYSATDVQLGAVLTGSPVAETVDEFVARNVALIKDVSAQAQGRIADAVFRGYQERTPARDVAKSIREATGMARDRSVRIASDQNTKLSAALDRERQLEAGLTLGRWRHSSKKHPRKAHVARDGKVYDLKTGKQRNPDGTAMDGGDQIESGDWPGQPPFCGCRMSAYLPIMAEVDV
jgi:uncharacterized protein with gpF-like domain